MTGPRVAHRRALLHEEAGGDGVAGSQGERYETLRSMARTTVPDS